MKNVKTHIIFKIVTLTLAVSVLFPTAIRFAHILTHHNHEHSHTHEHQHNHEHEHDSCTDLKTTCLNKKYTDCDFYNFKLSTSFYLYISHLELIINLPVFKNRYSLYTFFNKHKQLPFSLRGPPFNLV